MTGTDRLLGAARVRLDRLEPDAAQAAVLAGARMIDIRSETQLRRDGLIPGALIIPRNVAEWRLEPDGAYRHPDAPEPGDWTIVVCHEGYQSSLLASTLVDLGYSRATDLAGGFRAWSAAGLPVSPCTEADLAAIARVEAEITGAGLRV